jgi:hypothetical protein
MSAAAAQPDRLAEKGRPDFVIDFPAGSLCPFALQIDIQRHAGVDLTFSNGVDKTAYTFFITVTNTDSGETRVLHEAGNVVTTPLNQDTTETVTDGRELSAFSPGQLGPGQPGALLFIVGRSREVDQTPGPNPDPIFGFTTLSFQVLSGSAENLCETMA